MSLIDLIYGKLDPENRKGYERLFCEEINVYLKRIHSKLGKRMKWKPILLSPHQLELKDTSSGETKQWVVELMPPENIRKGDIGKVVATSNKISWDVLRNQRALLIAAELYVYHAFSLDRDPKRLESIRLQNQYIDMWRKLTGRKTAEHIRDKALQYIIHAIGEEKLAFYSPKGFFMSLRRLESHDKELARTLGATEDTFKRLKRHGKKRYSAAELAAEETLIRNEISHIDHILELLAFDKRDRAKLGQHSKLVDKHIATLRGFRTTLSGVMKGIGNWEHKRKRSHLALRSSRIEFEHAHRSAKFELSKRRIDMRKIYLIMGHFQKEKINILRDSDMLNDKLEKKLIHRA